MESSLWLDLLVLSEILILNLWSLLPWSSCLSSLFASILNDLFSKLYGLREVVLVIESHDEDEDVTKSVCVHEMFLCLPNGPTVGSPERFWYWGPDLFSAGPYHHHHNHHHGYPAHCHHDIIPPRTIWAVMIMVGICQWQMMMFIKCCSCNKHTSVLGILESTSR